MAGVASALGVLSPLHDDVVVCKEHEILLESLLRQETGPVIVTGHLGNGKTAFLLCLLLYRLERRQPTALQLNGKYYFMFNEDGVNILPLGHKGGRPLECWALVDGNDEVTMPCRALSIHATRVIHTAAPRVQSWKSWKKHHGADLYVLDLPDGMEIAAIVRENGYEPARTLSYVNKWGPSVPTVLRIMAAANISERALEEVEQELESSVKAVAVTICEGSCSVYDEDYQASLGSDILFSVPRCDCRPDGDVAIHRCMFMLTIPTEYLAGIFFSRWTEMEHDEAMDLYHCFNLRGSSEKSSTAWLYQMRVHAYLGEYNLPLSIFRGNIKSKIKLPSRTRVIPYTISSIKSARLGVAFYRYLSRMDFPCIDGLLRVGSRDAGRIDVYAVHATISETHGSSPVDGLRRLFPLIEHLIPDGHALNLLVVSDEEEVVERSVARFSDEVKRLVLMTGRGRTRKRVRVLVWGCVFPVI